jgi:SWI2/SNF2 ATPase
MLTMLTVAAKLLRETPGAEKPTVLMLIDRNELEGQLHKNIIGYGLSSKVAESRKGLQDILGSDYRGLLCDTREYSENESSIWRARVHTLVQAYEVDPQRSKFFRRVHQME